MYNKSIILFLAVHKYMLQAVAENMALSESFIHSVEFELRLRGEFELTPQNENFIRTMDEASY